MIIAELRAFTLVVEMGFNRNANRLQVSFSSSEHVLFFSFQVDGAA